MNRSDSVLIRGGFFLRQAQGAGLSVKAEASNTDLFEAELGNFETEPIADKIKSRGYWRITIRPTEYLPNRIASISDLNPLAQRLAVDIREWGWDFPYVDMNLRDLSIYQSSIAQKIEWENFIELWRFYQSGQFAYLGAVVTDWPSSRMAPAPPNVLFAEDVIAKYIEILEFAARLSASPTGSDRMWIQVVIYGIRARSLVSASSSPLFNMALSARQTTYNDGEFVHQEEIPREQLLANSRKIALRWARELFSRFGWNPEDEVLSTLVAKVLRPRATPNSSS